MKKHKIGHYEITEFKKGKNLIIKTSKDSQIIVLPIDESTVKIRQPDKITEDKDK